MAKRVMNGLDLNGQRIINVGDPSGAADAVTKSYVDGLVNGLSWKNAVRAATTGNITLSGTQSIDGVSVVAGNRVLVMAQTAGAQNGIYVVAAGAWSRAADADAAAELVNATVYVSEGTANGDKAFTCTNDASLVLGTTALNFAPVSNGGGTTYTAGNGLTGSTTFSVQPDGTSLSVSASGVRIADAAAANGLTSSGGLLSVGQGTGISVTADAVGIDTGVVVRKYAANIGNGAATSIAVTHGLGTKDITYSLQVVSSGEFVDTDAVATDVNTLTFTFPTAPSSGQYRVVVHG